ncbi:MAG: hypothetical protein JRI28_03130 [Deltaproteobacteria bacterium]|nr:hypothetical protein [Deltaproteobacteria bacterium]
MPSNNAGNTRSTLIDTVQTPLGFFVLVVLVVEAGLMTLAGTVAQEGDRSYLYSIVGLLVLLILVVAVTAFLKPEALSGQRKSAVEEDFAEALAKDVFEAFDGYLSNEDEESRAEAYEYFADLCKGSRYYEVDVTKSFASTFVSTVIKRADIKHKPRVAGAIGHRNA